MAALWIGKAGAKGVAVMQGPFANADEVEAKLPTLPPGEYDICQTIDRREVVAAVVKRLPPAAPTD